MIKQEIMTFYEVKDGVVKVLYTEPIFTPPAKRDKENMRKEGNGNGRGN